MTITAAHIEKVLKSIPGAWGGQVASPADLANGANIALATAPSGLTVDGAASFLATMSQESASFRYLHEAGSASYLKSKKYYPFIGRTFEQLTWKDNYSNFGKWCKAKGLLDDDQAFVKNPAKLADLTWAWLGGIWFWEKNGIWEYGNKSDFLATQRAVNLGDPNSRYTPVGFATRNAWYQAWRKIGTDLLPAPPAPPAPTGKGIDMATAKFFYFKNTNDQPLKVGENVIQLNDKGDVSVVVGANDGIDCGTVVQVVRETTVPVEGSDQNKVVRQRVYAGDDFEVFFRVVDYAPAGAAEKSKTFSDRVPDGTASAFFKGPMQGDIIKGHSLRLRLVVIAKVPGLILDVTQTSGWKM